jgi:large subunit ribosomal protein L3
MKGLIGKKIGMTQVFKEDGTACVVTVVECQPNKIVRIKTQEKDGYNALVLGACEIKRPKKTKKFAVVREFKVDNCEEFKDLNDQQLSILEEGVSVKVTGTSKGKGFQGTIKRFNFSRGPETHGSHHHREPGSVGACAKPGRISKGKKLPGRMGAERVSLRGVKVVSVDPENNLLCLNGSLPGANGSVLRIEIDQ